MDQSLVAPRRLRIVVLGAVVAIVAPACGDDDGESVGSLSADACAAYAEVELAADAALAIDVAASGGPELQAALDDLTTSISTFAAAAGVDDEGIQADIEGAVDELPTDPDLSDQLQLNGVRDTRDIVVADTRAWLEGLDVDCP